MPASNFIKQNLALIAGIAIPVVMMGVFFVAATLPRAFDPPEYDMVFSVQDHSGGNQLPLSVNLIVKDGTLTAQYTRLTAPAYQGWKKLYLFDAKTQKVRELPFGYPENMDAITGTRTDVVEATKAMKISTQTEAPDGYTLSYGGYTRSGLLDGLLWGGGYSSEARLRKGGGSIKLAPFDDRAQFYYGNIQFIGWVTP